MPHKLLLLLLLSFFLMLVVATGATAATRHGNAPDFELPTATGTVSLHDLHGKVALVDFWASWCGPCRESFPWMSAMLEKYGPQGLVIVAVNLDKARESADRFLQKYPAPFLVAFDPAGRTAEAFRVQAMPSSFIVSRTGTIVYAHEGFEASKAPMVEEKIREALAK